MAVPFHPTLTDKPNSLGWGLAVIGAVATDKARCGARPSVSPVDLEEFVPAIADEVRI